eukprot:EG_transcript_19016
MAFPGSRRAAAVLMSHALSSVRRLQSANLPPAEMSPFALARDAEARLLQRGGVAECTPPPMGGELGHLESPESDAKAVDYVHKLHDSFLLSKPLPPNPRQAALAQSEEEEDVQEEDNIYVEMVRAKYKDMKRREKDNGIVAGITNRYAQQVRAKATAARAASFSRTTKPKARPAPSPSHTSPASAEEEEASATPTAPLPPDTDAALRMLEYRITMLQSQLQHQQQAASRHQRGSSPGTAPAAQPWAASLSGMVAGWRGSRTRAK